jgi:hypothetical protein
MSTTSRFLIAFAVVLAIVGVPQFAFAKTFKNLLSQPDWYRYGVNPWDKDTDNDGITDDWEVKNGWCPTFPGQIPLTDTRCKKGLFNLQKETYQFPKGVNFYLPRTIRTVATCNVLNQVLTQEPVAHPSLDQSFSALTVYGGNDQATLVTDKQFAYILNGSTLSIAPLDPRSRDQVVAKIALSSAYIPERLWLQGDILLVTGKAARGRTAVESATMMELWNVHTPKKPTLIRTLTFSGDILGSHEFDGSVYLTLVPQDQTALVASGTAVRPTDPFSIPDLLKGIWFYRDLRSYVKDENKTPWKVLSRCNDVSYLSPIRHPGYLEVVAVSLRFPLSAPFQKTFWGVGVGDQLYFSTSSLYLASADNNYSWYGADAQERTEIQAFSLGKNSLVWRSAKTVPGTIVPGALNEYLGNVRVATTMLRSPSTTAQNNTINSIYFLDNDLNRVAWYEGFAPYERLVDVVFQGERLYVRTDFEDRGLIVIAYGADKTPHQLGRLPAVGLSAVQSFGKDYLVGIGSNATLSKAITPGFAWYQGLKLSLINISTPDRFSEVPVFLGDRGSMLTGLQNDSSLVVDSAGYVGFSAALATLPQSSKQTKEPTSSPFGVLGSTALYVYRIVPEQTPVFLGSIDPDTAENRFGPATITNVFIQNGFLYTQSALSFTIHKLPELNLVKEIRF